MTPANLKSAGHHRTPASFKTLRPIEDTKRLLTISEYGSVSRIRKTQTDICLHDDMFRSFSHEENGRHHHLGDEDMPVLLLPNLESRSLNKKSLKRLTTLPCSKRPKAEQQNESVMTAKIDDHDAKKVGHDHVRSISDEKCRIIKQKRGHDSKKIDKKSFKASVKTKFDTFPSKAGFISPDSASGGIDAIVQKAGIYGFKSDLHDVTKSVEELSLDDLLDSTYTYSNLCVEKRKNASNGNENILVSVRKACSILPLCGAANSGVNIKALTSPQNSSSSTVNKSDGDGKENCSEELSKKDSCQAILSTSPLYQPKDILDRLALLPPPDLEVLKSNFNPSWCTLGNKAFPSISLPPFSWSIPQGGTCKSGADSCKFNQPRSAYQSKWVRIGSNSSTGNNNCFFGLGVKTHDPNDDFANQRKIDELLQYVKSLVEHIITPVDEYHVLEHSNLIKGTTASGLFDSRKLERLDGHANISDNPNENDTKDYLFCHNSKSEVGLGCLRNELESANSPKYDSLKGNEVGLEERPERITDYFSGSCFSYPSKCSTGRFKQSLWHSPEISKPGTSSDVLAAAAILCEMVSSSNALSAQNDACERIKWPPSQKSIKERKSAPRKKTERSTLAPRHHDPFKRLPSTKLKPTSEKRTELVHLHNVGRESVNWSLPAEACGASPRKLERDRVRENRRLLQGNPSTPPGRMQSPTRLEKVYGSHPKPGKETLKASPVGSREQCVDDWGRGRSRKGGIVHYPNTRGDG